jgi:uncharacterized membrane protein YeaQ/YmgE (transglycosylase-associated protein family)
MEIIYVIIAMIVVGLIMGYIAGLIWKDDRNNYPTAIITAVIVGLLDFYVIPMMGFSDTMKWLGVALEPALSVLLVLWIIRYAKRDE